MIDYKKELNEQQLAAVTAEPGPILVIAGAGSGKTRTLTYRVAHLIESGCPSDRILLLTFTNKASREMLGRVGNLMGADASGIWGGTFHSIANRILRRHPKAIGYEPNYTILDQEDSKGLVQTCLTDAGIDRKDKNFPKPDVLLEIYGMATNTRQTVAQMIAKQYEYFSTFLEPIVAIKKLYSEHKKRLNAMDYDDLLFNFYTLLSEHPDAAEIYGRQFLTIMVDEYQDTSKIQSDIVDLIAKGHENLMVVGDDAQSIYSWRGACFRNIMEFPKRYPNARVFKIEHNYRSTPQILDLANRAIQANIHQFKKNLTPVREDGPKPMVVPLLNVSEQAAFVSSCITDLHDQGTSLNDIAVLYRSHFHSMELQMEMTRRSIPFFITSGLRFFEQAHVKDVAAYLKLAANRFDEIAFKRIALMMPKIGAATAVKLWGKLQKEMENTAETPNAPDPFSNYDCILNSVPKPAQKDWKQFAETMRQLRDPELKDRMSDMIHMVLDAGYEDYLKGKFDNYLSRREDLEQLSVYAERFKTAEEFLAELALMTNAETEEKEFDQDKEAVRLSTVHQAKGQEFGVVFVIWLADSAFPHSRALNSPDGEEEERRLFYVAVTRAKDSLYLTYPELRTSGFSDGDAFLKPSRFLQEIPKTFYQKQHVNTGSW